MVIKVIREVFSQKIYILGWFALSVSFFFAFLLIQVKTIPGNDFLFQLQLLSLKDYSLFSLLSLLAGLSFLMQWYLLKQKRKAMGAIGSGIAGGFWATIGSIFGSATCASCIAALFGFLGVGTVFTLLDYRNYIVAASVAFLGISIYFASQKVIGACKSCETK
ncbi:MAG: hypothetical protein HY001_04585 [Candidatus Portnoybacteria bacterium]|nr:hypothetical protein [Candidatus Portnoybacteria bacterium]